MNKVVGTLSLIQMLIKSRHTGPHRDTQNKVALWVHSGYSVAQSSKHIKLTASHRERLMDPVWVICQSLILNILLLFYDGCDRPVWPNDWMGLIELRPWWEGLATRSRYVPGSDTPPLPRPNTLGIWAMSSCNLLMPSGLFVFCCTRMALLQNPRSVHFYSLIRSCLWCPKASFTPPTWVRGDTRCSNVLLFAGCAPHGPEWSQIWLMPEAIQLSDWL